MSTIRTATNVIRAFPALVENVRQRVDPLDMELSVIRALNWELNKLPNDESVARCIQFLMQQRGVHQSANGDIENVHHQVRTS
mgnify:CR=1 FL=1